MHFFSKKITVAPHTTIFVYRHINTNPKVYHFTHQKMTSIGEYHFKPKSLPPPVAKRVSDARETQSLANRAAGKLDIITEQVQQVNRSVAQHGTLLQEVKSAANTIQADVTHNGAVLQDVQTAENAIQAEVAATATSIQNVTTAVSDVKQQFATFANQSSSQQKTDAELLQSNHELTNQVFELMAEVTKLSSSSTADTERQERNADSVRNTAINAFGKEIEEMQARQKPTYDQEQRDRIAATAERDAELYEENLRRVEEAAAVRAKEIEDAQARMHTCAKCGTVYDEGTNKYGDCVHHGLGRGGSNVQHEGVRVVGTGDDVALPMSNRIIQAHFRCGVGAGTMQVYACCNLPFEGTRSHANGCWVGKHCPQITSEMWKAHTNSAKTTIRPDAWRGSEFTNEAATATLMSDEEAAWKYNAALGHCTPPNQIPYALTNETRVTAMIAKRQPLPINTVEDETDSGDEEDDAEHIPSAGTTTSHIPTNDNHQSSIVSKHHTQTSPTIDSPRPTYVVQPQYDDDDDEVVASVSPLRGKGTNIIIPPTAATASPTPIPQLSSPIHNPPGTIVNTNTDAADDEIVSAPVVTIPVSTPSSTDYNTELSEEESAALNRDLHAELAAVASLQQ
jgi:hypothetical protein